jgi:hypothetical protein
MRPTLRRIRTVAVVHARELGRHTVAVVLLVGLPPAFYGALAGHSPHAIVPGTIATAFSISGTGIFTMLAARPLDPRLALAGYRFGELAAGRLVFLAATSLPVLAATCVLMIRVSHPADAGALVEAVALMGLVALPLGLCIGVLLPRELEANLVLIGIVGIQLTLDPEQGLAKAFPFYGARQVLEVALGDQASAPVAVPAAIEYAAGLLALALTIGALRLHRPADATPVAGTQQSVG